MPERELTDVARLRAGLADQHPEFAAAEVFERDIERECLELRARLKAARRALGIDQAVVAARMQVGQPMISRIENGTGDIGIKTLYRYASALGLQLCVGVREDAVSKAAVSYAATASAVEEALVTVDKARELLVAASEQLISAA
jgi:transcriptional regulator with XRE-family HTH domain